MKIAYLLQVGEELRRPPYNGPAIHIRQVVTELGRLGHQVHLLFRLDGRLWRSDDLEHFAPVHVSLLDRGPLRWIERLVRRVQRELRLPYLAWFESLRFALACRQELPGMDIYYERSAWMAYGAALAIGWRPHPAFTRLVLEYNGDPLADLQAQENAPRGLQRWLAVNLAKLNFRGAHAVIASGAGWRDNLVQGWGVPPEKITVVENGSELVRLLRREQLSSFQAPDGGTRQEGGVRLVYLGGFHPWQGVDRLLRVLARIEALGQPAQLVMIGSGTGLKAARTLADELGVSARVRFTGQLPAQEYAPLLAEADIGLSPYCGWQEYSGLKLFDYKAAGLAIIASGQDDQPACLQHAVTGWIIQPCDEDALLQAILHLAGQPELRRRLGQQARCEAEVRHGWEHTARQLDQVFTRLLVQR